MARDVNALFELLDRWRHLPNYQLERRADIFFGLYLPKLLGDRFDVSIQGVVPEFPIKRDLIWPSHPTNKSVKVDYVALSKDRGRCFFVELKTDVESRREAQDHYLETCRELGFVTILDGLLSIVKASSAHQKYFHLLSELAGQNCLNLPPELAEFIFPQARPGLRKLQEQIEVCVERGEFEIEVVYIQPIVPQDNPDRVIGFEEMASWLEGKDEIAQVFAEYLRRWTRPAGALTR